MLESTDAALVGTSIVLAVSTIVSVALQLDRQYKVTGHLNASKCESKNTNSLHQLCKD